VRELLNNHALERVPVGFVDDDRRKHATRIHGLPVFGGCEQLETLVREHGIAEVIVSSAKIHGNGLDAVTRSAAGWPCRSGEASSVWSDAKKKKKEKNKKIKNKKEKKKNIRKKRKKIKKKKKKKKK